jgi:hypothetical protein
MISVTNGNIQSLNIRSSEYVGDLQEAMEMLAQNVATETNAASGRIRKQRQLRKLQVTLDRPTVDGLVQTSMFQTETQSD